MPITTASDKLLPPPPVHTQPLAVTNCAKVSGSHGLGGSGDGGGLGGGRLGVPSSGLGGRGVGGGGGGLVATPPHRPYIEAPYA